MMNCEKHIKRGWGFLSLLALCSILYGGDVDQMLHSYEKANALSQRTIDENKGHLVLFTREKLERMHAKTLKDVFKTLPVIYYHENRYGLPDPLASGTFDPYRSNFIRIFIDGVEITEGWAGSGLILYGDITIDFVDHIEVYDMAPSFETSTEPAFLTIYLYSKDPSRDSGGKVNLGVGSRGYGYGTFSYGGKEGETSYMINLSHMDAKRAKIDNGTAAPLSRDFERWQLFSYIKNEDQTFHLQVVKKDTDSLAGASWDATPTRSQIDFLNLHLDYGIDITSHWHMQFAYDRLRSHLLQADDQPLAWLAAQGGNSLDATVTNSTFTAEMTYQETFGDHRIMAGVKGRQKQLDTINVAGVETNVMPEYNRERVASLFVQDQYMIAEGKMLSAGVSFNHIQRNGGMEDDSLLQLRIGYIYSSEAWNYKVYLYRTQVALDPVTRGYYPGLSEGVEPQTSWGVSQEISYRDKDQYSRLLLNVMKDEDGLLQNTLHARGNTKYYTAIFNYDRDFNRDDKLNLQFYYAHYEDIFNFDSLDDISGYVSLYNSWGDLDFYNGVVWHRNSIDWENYFDWTSSISWSISETLTLTLKGDNILDRAKESALYRVDISSGVPVVIQPLSISPIDRRFTIELEYMF